MTFGAGGDGYRFGTQYSAWGSNCKAMCGIVFALESMECEN